MLYRSNICIWYILQKLTPGAFLYLCNMSRNYTDHLVCSKHSASMDVIRGQSWPYRCFRDVLHRPSWLGLCVGACDGQVANGHVIWNSRQPLCQMRNQSGARGWSWCIAPSHHYIMCVSPMKSMYMHKCIWASWTQTIHRGIYLCICSLLYKSMRFNMSLVRIWDA